MYRILRPPKAHGGSDPVAMRTLPLEEGASVGFADLLGVRGMGPGAAAATWGVEELPALPAAYRWGGLILGR